MVLLPHPEIQTGRCLEEAQQQQLGRLREARGDSRAFCAKKSARVSSAAAEKIMHLHRLLLYYVQLLNAAQRSGGGIHPRLFQLHPRFQSDRCYLKKSDFKDSTSKAKINLNFVSDNLI